MSPSDGAALSTIFQMLRRSTGLDFTHYRQTTILRAFSGAWWCTRWRPAGRLRPVSTSNAGEIKALYQDMLINVTSFFRNPAVLMLLSRWYFHSIMKHAESDA